MLEVIVSFLIGLSIGLAILAVLLKRQVNKTIPTFFDERQYKRIQKDLDNTLEKIRNIGWQTASARSIIDINNDERITAWKQQTR